MFLIIYIYSLTVKLITDFSCMFSHHTIAEHILKNFLQLDDWDMPGLPEAEFLGLFTRCLPCGLVMTSRVFQQHTQTCAATTTTIVVIHDIIDLTNNSDDEECSGVIDLTLDE